MSRSRTLMMFLEERRSGGEGEIREENINQSAKGLICHATIF